MLKEGLWLQETETLTWERFLSAPSPRYLVVGLGLVTLFLILAVALASVPYTP